MLGIYEMPVTQASEKTMLLFSFLQGADPSERNLNQDAHY